MNYARSLWRLLFLGIRLILAFSSSVLKKFSGRFHEVRVLLLYPTIPYSSISESHKKRSLILEPPYHPKLAVPLILGCVYFLSNRNRIFNHKSQTLNLVTSFGTSVEVKVSEPHRSVGLVLGLRQTDGLWLWV